SRERRELFFALGTSGRLRFRVSHLRSHSSRAPERRQREKRKEQREAKGCRHQPANSIARPGTNAVVDPPQRQKHKNRCHAFVEKLPQRPPNAPKTSNRSRRSGAGRRGHDEILAQNRATRLGATATREPPVTLRPTPARPGCGRIGDNAPNLSCI